MAWVLSTDMHSILLLERQKANTKYDDKHWSHTLTRSCLDWLRRLVLLFVGSAFVWWLFRCEILSFILQLIHHLKEEKKTDHRTINNCRNVHANLLFVAMLHRVWRTNDSCKMIKQWALVSAAKKYPTTTTTTSERYNQRLAQIHYTQIYSTGYFSILFHSAVIVNRIM